MEKDLKAQNMPFLAAIHVGTFTIVASVHWGTEPIFATTLELGQQGGIAAAIAAFGWVLSNIAPNSVKHSLVYLRVRNALSGHRCKRICMKDSRFSTANLKSKWPTLFLKEMEESEQNAFWYNNIYKPVRNHPEVVQAHRSFLLFRDAASGLFVLLVGLLVWKLLGEFTPIPSLNIWSEVILVCVVLLLCLAAQQSGNRMVANAVAVALYK